VQAVEKAVPSGQRVLVVGDRESDIYDLFTMPRRSETDLLVRGNEDRRVYAPERKLWAAEAAPVIGGQRLFLQAGNRREARAANVEIRLSQQTIFAPSHTKPPVGTNRPLCMQMSAILVQEVEPPEGIEPLCWLLLTTLLVEDLAGASQCIQWYTWRWLIERSHFVLKSGCQLEKVQLESAERLQRALATYCVVAWRLLWLTYQARCHPDDRCETALQRQEWQALQAAITKNPQVGEQPKAVRWIAQLGGFLGRKSDGEPGVKTLWLGLRRLEDLALMWVLLHPNAPPSAQAGQQEETMRDG
jgi:hypothetical protein